VAADEAVLADPPLRRRRRRVTAALVIAGVVALNVTMYALLATEPAQRFLDALAGWTYPGVFALSAIANAGVLVGLPYNAVVLQIAATDELPWLVALAAAAGSTLGETTGWIVGRQGGKALPEGGRLGRFVGWLRDGTRRPARAFAAIAAFAAIPNYAFDVAGLAAGALGIRYRVFLAATFTGRLLRFAMFALAGPFLLSVWTSVWSAVL
jgi:membrane protein YqaA with SNARE-associated domain